MPEFDPRTTLAREDLADLALEGVVRAGRFAPTRPMQASAPVAAVRAGPEAGAAQLDQLVYGEAFDVLETRDGWAWGQARRDGVVGWASLDDLRDGVRAPTHRVAAVSAAVLRAPQASAPETARLPMNALVAAEGREGPFLRLADGGWVATDALAGLETFDRDAAGVAERFLGAPYLRGGRAGGGVDAPALVQQALYACGLGCPREADMQASLGAPVPGRGQLRRGDLVCWEGHVALMLDDSRLVHADPALGAVAAEALDAAVARAGEPVALRRP